LAKVRDIGKENLTEIFRAKPEKKRKREKSSRNRGLEIIGLPNENLVQLQH